MPGEVIPLEYLKYVKMVMYLFTFQGILELMLLNVTLGNVFHLLTMTKEIVLSRKW
jgi:hypothetical protein